MNSGYASAGTGMPVVGCPFCLAMLNDASREDGCSLKVLDVAGLVAEKQK